MFEPIIIHNDEKVLTVDLHQKLLLYEIKASDKIPPPEVALKIDNAIIGTLGNILSIIGKAKSRNSPERCRRFRHFGDRRNDGNGRKRSKSKSDAGSTKN